MKITPVYSSGLNLYSYMGDHLATFTSHNALDQAIESLNHATADVAELETKLEDSEAAVRELTEQKQDLEDQISALTSRS